MIRRGLLEIRLLAMNRVVLGLSLLLVVLASFSGWVGGEAVRARAAAIAAAVALEEATDAEALETADRIRAGEIDPPWYQSPLHAQAWSYAMIRHVHLPPRPWGAVSTGDADLRPYLFRINPHPPDRWSNRVGEGTPSIAANGGLDLAEVIFALTPLLVLVALTDVIRDRAGSERQHLAIVQRGSELALLRARLVPRAIAVLFLVGVGGFAGLVSTLPPPSATLGTGAAVVGVFLAHAAFWLIAAAGLIVAFRSSAATYAAFTTLWFVLGIVAPVLTDSLARRLDPPPAPLEVFSEERSALVSARNRKTALVREFAEEDSAAGNALLRAAEEGQQLITPTNLLIEREVDAVRGDDRERDRTSRESYERRLAALNSLSPTQVARRQIHSLAGRDRKRRAAFEEQVAAYHDYLQQLFVPHLLRRTSPDTVILPEPFAFAEPAA